MPKQKTCLNCRYEPEWGEPSKGEYSRYFGKCKLVPVLPVLPAVMWVQTRGITRFAKDDSGVETNCKAWEAK